jgi:menaquinone-dependent protoporphyrinogen IX oxidase
MAARILVACAQLDKALTRTPAVKPSAVAIFGGVLDRARLNFPFNRRAAVEARDWNAIRAWADEVARVFAYGKPASEARDPRRELQQTHR